MKHLSSCTAVLGFSLITLLATQAAPALVPVAAPIPVEAAAPPPAAPPAVEVKDKDPLADVKRKEQEALAVENKLEAERLIQVTNAVRAEIYQIKLNRELATEKLATENFKRQFALQEELLKIEAEKEKLTLEGELAKVRAEKLANELKSVQSAAALETAQLKNEIDSIEATEKRAKFADAKPVFLATPLKDGGTLVISDRRIPLNGLITNDTANFITSRIQYWNNKDRKLPIFIVIDASPGGSVMVGYRILKAMESSEAPVHVVVKSFAASMAAAITTLAKESYAYPNAVILHHQVSAIVFAKLNLTEQREFHEETQRWWLRLGTPIAKKMGITPDEFVKKMYLRSSSGDWSEFGEQAKELKWVNHIVNGIDETSFTKDPDSLPKSSAAGDTSALVEQVDAEGRPFVWLPHLNPKDVYFIYNADGYYRLR
mgnify:FL=1